MQSGGGMASMLQCILVSIECGGCMDSWVKTTHTVEKLGKDYTYSRRYSGIAIYTPGHTQACAHVKFTGARLKIQVQT